MTDETPARRRTWVGEWVRSETFWQNVTSQALGGMAVLVAAAGLAAAVGIIDWPATGKVTVVALVVLLAGVVMLGAAVGLGAMLRPINTRAQKWPWGFRLLWDLVVTLLAGAILILCLTGASAVIRSIVG